MIAFDRQELMQPQNMRQKKKSLKFLREAFESQNKYEGFSNVDKKKPELQMLMSSMRVNRLKNTFYKKLTMNNIFQEPITFELLSEEEKNNKRLIKMKGIYLHTHILSLFFVLQMIFLIITFIISSWMAFLPDFIQSKIHMSTAVVILEVLAFIMSCIKFVIMSMSQKIENGILVSYITDIVIGYAQSLMMAADLLFIVVLGVLLIARQSGVQSIQGLSAVLFICSIVKIILSNTNLTLFRTTFMTSSRMDQYYKLTHLIIFNLIFAHFIASMLLAMAGINNTMNWMINKNLQHESWYVQYMWGYYWATTTMMTVGFGDFTAITYEEAFIVAFLQFFSCIVLAYNISEIGGIISTIRSSENEFITKIALFKRMANQNEIDHELKHKIESYLREQKAIKEKFEFNEQNQLIETLPEPLRKEYIMSSNGRFFKYLPFFKTLQKNTLVKFAQTLTSKVYYPSQLLSRANQCNERIMILKDGKVGLGFKKVDSRLNGIIVEEIEIIEREFMTNEGQKIVKNLPVLLNTQFLTPGKMANYDTIALTYCNVSLLSHQNFLSIIKESDIDTEYFFSIIHRRSINGNQWEQLPCDNCISELRKNNKKNDNILDDGSEYINDDAQRLYFHSKFDCPRLHYFPLHGVAIYKYLTLIGQPQQRKTIYHRKQRKNQANCLMLRKYAFKTYEKLKMIEEKKIIYKSNQKIAELRSMRQHSKESMSENMSLRRHKSDTKIQSIPKRNQFLGDLKKFVENKKLLEPSIENQQLDQQIFQEDQLFQSILFYQVKQTFWDIEIDLMANYFNYFPLQNAAKLDNVDVCRNKASKIKGFCMLGDLLKSKNVKGPQTPSKKLTLAESLPDSFPSIKIIPQNHETPQKKVHEKTQIQILSEEKQKYDQRYKDFQFFFPKQQNPTLGETVRENVRMQYSTSVNEGGRRVTEFQNDNLPTIRVNQPTELQSGKTHHRYVVFNNNLLARTYPVTQKRFIPFY